MWVKILVNSFKTFMFGGFALLYADLFYPLLLLMLDVETLALYSFVFLVCSVIMCTILIVSNMKDSYLLMIVAFLGMIMIGISNQADPWDIQSSRLELLIVLVVYSYVMTFLSGLFYSKKPWVIRVNIMVISISLWLFPKFHSKYSENEFVNILTDILGKDEVDKLIAERHSEVTAEVEDAKMLRKLDIKRDEKINNSIKDAEFID